MEVLQFKDPKCTPDIVHPYTPALRNNNTPIIIDNGKFLKLSNITSHFCPQAPTSVESGGVAVRSLCCFSAT